MADRVPSAPWGAARQRVPLGRWSSGGSGGEIGRRRLPVKHLPLGACRFEPGPEHPTPTGNRKGRGLATGALSSFYLAALIPQVACQASQRSRVPVLDASVHAWVRGLYGAALPSIQASKRRIDGAGTSQLSAIATTPCGSVTSCPPHTSPRSWPVARLTTGAPESPPNVAR